MENNAPKPTLVLKIGGKKIKEYTRGRVILKLKQGVLSPETLVHNPDGLWRKVCETPGFRSLCAQILGGNDKPGQMPLIRPGNESEGSKTNHSSPEIACLKSEESIAFSIKLDGEDTLSREEFVIESEDDDSSGDLASPGAAGGQAELGLDDSRELPVGKDSVAAAVAAMDSSGEVAGPPTLPPDRSDSVNPYAARQYFRVKAKGRDSEQGLEAEEEPDLGFIWKKWVLIGVVGFWAVFCTYWFWSDWFGGGSAIDNGLSNRGTEVGREMVEAGETDPRAVAAGKGNSKTQGKTKDIWEAQKKAFELTKELYRQGK